MAFDAGAVVGRFVLDVSNWVKGAQTVQKSSEKLTKAVGKNSKKLEKTVSKSNKKIGDSFKGLGKIMKAAGAAFLATDLLKSFEAQEQATAKLNAVLKATGGAAGLTAKEMKTLASQIQQTTTFSDEAVINAQALLATFKSIGRETFPRATKAIVDLSAAFGQDLRQSTIQVAKALEDPKKGLGALSRIGVTFSKQQADLIKGFQESGNLAKAQAEILKTLEGQVKGTAAAMAKTSTGALKQFNNLLGDVKEQGGKVIAGALLPLTRGLSDLFKGFLNNTTEADKFNITLVGLTAAATALGGPIAGLVTLIAGLASEFDRSVKFAKLLTEAETGNIKKATDYIKVIKRQTEDIKSLRKEGIFGADKLKVSELSLQKTQLNSIKFLISQASNVKKLTIAQLQQLEALKKSTFEANKRNIATISHFHNVKSLNKITKELTLRQTKAKNAIKASKDAAVAAARASKEKTAAEKADSEALKTSIAIIKNNLKAKIDVFKATGQVAKALELEKQAAVEKLTIDNATEDSIRRTILLFDLKIAKAGKVTDAIKSQTDEEAELFETLGVKIQSSNVKTTKAVQDNWKKTFEAIDKGVAFVANVWRQASTAISGVSDQFFKNQNTNIENDYINKRNVIEKNITDEKEKKKRIEQLDREKNRKIAKAQVAQFNVTKAINIVESIVNTATAVTAALKVPIVGPVLAGVIGALGAAQTALIATQKPPSIPTFAKGGSARAGTTALVGEEGPELVKFKASASVAPANETRNLLSSRPITITNYFGDVKSEVDIERAMMIGAQKLKNKLRGAL